MWRAGNCMPPSESAVRRRLSLEKRWDGWMDESRHQSAMLVHPIPASTRFAGCCMLHLPQLRVSPSPSKLQLLLVNKKRHGVARAVKNESTRGGAIQIGCVVLDIEGTTTPISFVTDVLFPYARSNVRAHLAATYHTQETKEDLALLRAQVQQDLADGVPGTVPLPPEPDVDALVANVEAMIDADRKVTALKQLQGRIWRTGFQSGHIKGLVYDDVPQALAKWHAAGIKCYIYSSGSREAQRLIFGNTTHGDLRKYLCGFFDTTTGPKREARSYYEIWQSVGVDHPSQILFLTDVHQEATAAKGAGLEVLISIRPGNAPLPENHGFQTITSFAEISI